MLGLAHESPEIAVEAYASAIEDLRDQVGIERSFQEVGVDEAEFMSSLDTLAMNAYEDQCAPANPRMPMLDDMKTMMEAAYYGTSFEAVRSGTVKEQPARSKRAKKANSAS